MNPRILVMLLPLVLGGCWLSSVEAEEYAVYPLEAGAQRTRGEPVSWQLSIEEPVAATPLANTRIAVRDAERAYIVLAGARWSERAPELVQSALLRSFEDSGRIRGVVRGTSGVHGDYRLLIELRAFEADYDNGSAPAANIMLSAKLVRTVGTRVVDARLFHQRERAKGGDVSAIVAAFDRAAARLLPELRDWTLAAGEADWRATQR